MNKLCEAFRLVFGTVSISLVSYYSRRFCCYYRYFRGIRKFWVILGYSSGEFFSGFIRGEKVCLCVVRED